MYPHRIRLRGPWSAIGPDDQPRADGGRVLWRRRFGSPSRIDSYERVWLTFAGISGPAEVRLNGHVLGRREVNVGAFEFEVTSLLKPRNELLVELQQTTGRDVWRGEVALEVRCTAFLRHLRRSAIWKGDRADLRVTGEVVGVAEQPLELYIVWNRSVAAYQRVTPTGGGRPFEVVVSDLPPESCQDQDGTTRRATVKVDLVNGATVWYTSEDELTFETMSDQGT